MYGKPEAPASYLSALFAAQPKPDGIWFNRNNGDTVRFSEPMAFPRACFGSMYNSLYGISRDPDPGVYTILVADNSARPRPFRVLYFGQGGDMHERVTTSHERYQDWCRAAGGAENLRVAYHWMFGSTEGERVAIESGLIGYYRPQSNVTFNSFASSPFGSSLKKAFTLAGLPFVPAKNTEPDYMAEVARLLFGGK